MVAQLVLVLAHAARAQSRSNMPARAVSINLLDHSNIHGELDMIRRQDVAMREARNWNRAIPHTSNHDYA